VKLVDTSVKLVNISVKLVNISVKLVNISVKLVNISVKLVDTSVKLVNISVKLPKNVGFLLFLDRHIVGRAPVVYYYIHTKLRYRTLEMARSQ
jgi:hypothetical protein